MSSAHESPYSFSKSKDIQTSLIILKQLEEKLKINKNLESVPQQILFTHARVRTQPEESTPMRNNHSFGPIIHPFSSIENKQQIHKSPLEFNSIFAHSQPTMVQINQNEYISVKQIVKQNRKLKKYVNCLLQMNDYLKNQLIRKDQLIIGTKNMGHSFELDLMKMEIGYLKELNRDKELQLKRNQKLDNLESNLKKHSSNMKIKILDQMKNLSHKKCDGHFRSASVYQTKNRKLPTETNDKISDREDYTTWKQTSRYLKNMSFNQSKGYKPPYKNSQNSNKNPLKSKQTQKMITSKKKATQKKNIQKPSKKCRLCYI